MARVKTGGRQKGSKNKTPKYKKYDDCHSEIIDMLANRRSQADVLRALNKNHANIKFTKAGLCEYIKDTSLMPEVDMYIKELALKDLLNLDVKKRKLFNPIY